MARGLKPYEREALIERLVGELVMLHSDTRREVLRRLQARQRAVAKACHAPRHRDAPVTR